jgi:hypothetical protein
LKILLDENIDWRLRGALSGHEVVTVVYAGWTSLRNGELLNAAEAAGFEVFLTGDSNLSYQQNRSERSIALVVLTAHSWQIVRDHVGAIQAATDVATPGSFHTVECGRFRR